jgi:hypothetical protein
MVPSNALSKSVREAMVWRMGWEEASESVPRAERCSQRRSSGSFHEGSSW